MGQLPNPPSWMRNTNVPQMPTVKIDIVKQYGNLVTVNTKVARGIARGSGARSEHSPVASEDIVAQANRTQTKVS